MKIEVIDTGYFYADGGAMFGSIPKTAWQRKYPCDEDNRCKLVIRSLLIKTDEGKVILIDTGVGKEQLKALSWYRFTGMKDLRQELSDRLINPEDITDVVLTHLHFDHCGNHFFPNATYWISYAQWKNLLAPHPLEAASLFREELFILQSKNRIELVKEKKSLCPQVTLQLFDGHSAGQLVVEVKAKARKYIYAGDVIPLSACISPEWISAYDISPCDSYDAKIKLLEDAIKGNKAIFYCHDAYTVCTTIKKSGSLFKPDKKIELL